MIEDGKYCTEDLVEASVLSMHGHTPSFERANNGALFVFVFEDDEEVEFLGDLIESIKAGRCKVEPKRFAREMRHVRELLYEFMGVSRQPRRSSPRVTR